MQLASESVAIEGYDGDYFITSAGEVVSYKKNSFRILKPDIRKGYYCVTLCKDNKTKKHPVHRLLAKYFISNPDGKEFVNHIDSDKLNNKLENLEWVTQKENHEHAAREGLKMRGVDHHLTVFTEDDIREIRDRFKTEKCSYRGMGREYSIDKSTIKSIVERETWKHVK